MSSLGKDIQRYGHRVGVPPAKPLQMIIDEQERRKNFSQAGPTQSSDSKQQTKHQGEVPHEILATKELLMNKEISEYEETLAAQDGDGELPSGWEERREEEVFSPTDRGVYQHYRPFVSGNALFNNLRLHKDYPGFRLDSRMVEGLRAQNSMMEEGSGSDDPLVVNPNSSTQEGLTTNLVQIPQKGGLTELGTEQQIKQRSDKWGVAESTDGRNKGRIEVGKRQETDNSNPMKESYKDIAQSSLQGMGNSELDSKDKRGQKPEWWAQEQIDNVAHYAQIQEDIRALWDEIKAQGRGKQSTTSPHPIPSNFDQSSGPQAGNGTYQQTGPQGKYSRQGIFGFDLDEPSLTIDPMEYLTLRLSPQEIQKCKQACRGLGTRSNLHKRPWRSRDRSQKHSGKDGNEYFVELPPEEEDGPAYLQNSL